MIVVVIGVSASGKTAVGKALAERLHVTFADGDDFHSQANVAKMRAGAALDEQDRAPWLQSLHELLARAVHEQRDLVLACSALRRTHRNVLRGQLRDVLFVYLAVDRATLERRARQRQHAFMPAALLQSQLDTLEEPATDEAIVVDGARPVVEVVNAIARSLPL